MSNNEYKPWQNKIVHPSAEEQVALAALFSSETLRVMRDLEANELSWRRDNVPFPPSFGRESPEEPVKPWSVPRSTGWMLLSLILSARPRVILELGTSLGFSTLWLARAAMDVGATVDTVELMAEKARDARKNLTAAGFKNWDLHECDAVDLCSRWKKPIDFLFLDADAASYPRYWQALVPHLSERAFVVADNALTHPHLLAPFVDGVACNSSFRCFTHPMDHGLFMATRITH